MGELLTAVKHDMNITHVLINNGQLGKISKEQRAGDWDVWQTRAAQPGLRRVRRALRRARNPGDRGRQLDDALGARSPTTGPAMVEVVADAELV